VIIESNSLKTAKGSITNSWSQSDKPGSTAKKQNKIDPLFHLSTEYSLSYSNRDLIDKTQQTNELTTP
tara:strand:+ start:86 stop:289 length:204 start_codon:yes stop_codon:yes gene_type:complete